MTAHPQLSVDTLRLHRRVTRALARTFSGVPEPVREELVQDAWVALLAQRRALENPGAWLVRVASRRAIDWWRRQGRPGRAGAPLDDGLHDSLPDLLERLDGERLIQLLDRAPPSFRLVLERLYLDELALGELAAELGVSADSVYKRRDRALAWLREAVERRDAPNKPARKLSRKAQILEHLRAQGGWCNTMALRAALLPVLGGSRDRLTGELMALRREGRIEVRGARKRAEYRLVPAGSAP